MDTTVTNITTMWGFFAHLGPIQVTAMVLVIAIVLMIIILVTKPTIKIGSNSISFRKRLDDEDDEKLPAHATCIHNVDFCHIVSKTTEIVTKLCYIDHIDRVEKQMSYVEEKMTTVKSMLLDNYSMLLRSKIKDSTSITAHEDYITYHRLVESMLREDVKSFIKRSIYEENFEDLTDTEFKVFVNEKFDYMYQIASEFMDIWYISNKMLITRDEIKMSALQLRPKFLDLCFDVYSRAIRWFQEQQKEKDSLRKELDDFYYKIVGIKRTN
jgi:ubiquinone biosynthesis protein Coq4